MSDDRIINGFVLDDFEDQSQRHAPVVQALDDTVWTEVDAERKIRAKLQEFAAELQSLKSFLGTL